MSYVERPNVMQSCSAPGTGAFGSLMAITGRDAFSARYANGEPLEYFAIAVDATTFAPTGNWEKGTGTWNSSGSSITRSTVQFSSNADAAVNFTDALVYVMVSSLPVLPDYFCKLSADYTLTSTTSAQKLFNTTANGALTLQPGSYTFEALLYLTGMSATTGNGQFNLLGAGTATLDGILYSAYGIDSTTPLSAATQTGSGSVTSASAASIVSTGTGTGMLVTLFGGFDVTAAGTLIPSIALVTAVAAAVKKGSYIRIRNATKASTYYNGPWS